MDNIDDWWWQAEDPSSSSNEEGPGPSPSLDKAAPSSIEPNKTDSQSQLVEATGVDVMPVAKPRSSSLAVTVRSKKVLPPPPAKALPSPRAPVPLPTSCAQRSIGANPMSSRSSRFGSGAANHEPIAMPVQPVPEPFQPMTRSEVVALRATTSKSAPTSAPAKTHAARPSQSPNLRSM